MKPIGLLTLAILFSFIQLQAQSKKNSDEMVFDKTVDGMTAHDFGSIVYGANGKVDFKFTNKGKTPLVISDVKSSCDCAIPNWTKEPVAPGQTGVVKIEYNTKLPGAFNKTVVVYSNAKNSPVRIEIRGKINAQASDIQQSYTATAQPATDMSMPISTETQKGAKKFVPVSAEEAAVLNAKKAAQEQSLKNLVIQPINTQAKAPKKGTAVEGASTVPVKK